MGAPSASSIWQGLTEDRLRLARLPATPVASFFPPPSDLQRETKKPSPAAFHDVPAPRGAGPIVPGLTTAIEVAMVRPDRKRNTTMATIGTFTQNENGAGFTGAVKTLTLNVKAKFVLRTRPKIRLSDFSQL